MDKKERLVIYPYDIEAATILRNQELLPQFEIVGIVSPEGWGYGERDASVLNM